ncbi:signal peptidase I [Solibacillus sp. A46]|uniref:Signal peptidase I n=1 Tax=Solibacillus faecavium TaxID=2762221 RepID=A0ABR8XW80_9BACL|nr:signal peptidase I [Solibacillus faecavium]
MNNLNNTFKEGVLKIRLLTVLLPIFILVGCSQGNVATTNTITDKNTSEVLGTVTPQESQLLVEWNLDAMDRGNHDFNTMSHSELVVEPYSEKLQRGDVIYYQMLDSELEKNENLPKMYLGRVVGLPNEIVKIKGGQVYINDEKLDTFYGVAMSLGLTKEEYFETVDLKNINKEEMEHYFNTSMEPIKVKENTVFVLVDMWWRGTDSKDFGLLPEENIQGKVLGYKK